MRVVEVRITNVRSIESMTIKPGVLVVIEGDNGVGKTSVLLAIKTVFEGGHDPNLIRTGAKKAEVVLLLDNGTTIKRTITEKSSKLDVTTQDGMPVPEGPQHFVETLASGFSFDPLAFIEAKPKERLAYLQRALNLTFTPEEVAPVGLTATKPVDLDTLDNWRKSVYEARTKENGAARQAEATVERLSVAIPEDEATDWEEESARCRQELARISQAVASKVAEVKEFARAQKEAINSDIDEQIRELERRRSTDLAAAVQRQKNVEARAIAENQSLMDEANAALTTAQERSRQAARLQMVREEVENAKAEAAKHEALSKIMTNRLMTIDSLKQKKLDSLPIQGVEIKDGDFYCDGLPFDSLNTGAQYLKAFEVGALQPGSLGCMIADKSEHLGPENWELFKQAAVSSGFQVFVTRRTQGDLLVSMVGE